MAVPVSRVEEYNAILTTTARHLMPTVRDQISRSNKWVAWLTGNNRFRRVSGGERISVPLMTDLNGGADIYNQYGQLTTSPVEGITTAFYEWSQLSVPITISGKERRQNNSEEMMIDLLTTKINQSQASATQLLNDCITAGRITSGATGSLNQFDARRGKLDPSAEGPQPLAALVDANPSRAVEVGNINPSTQTFWRNFATASAATNFNGVIREMNNLYNNASRGVGGSPDLAICDQKVWELYFNTRAQLERYQVTSERIINILGGPGEDMLKFRNSVLIWDEVLPDVGTTTANVVDGIGTSLQDGAHGTLYFLNSEAAEYIVHSEADWIQTPFQTPINQDASIAQLLWQGASAVTDRRKHGVLYDIDNSIVA